mgnify:CR=1 FL=1
MIKSVIAGVPVGDDEPVRIMGVVNVSPESFYKGSVKTSREAVIETAESFARAGVDFIDVGGRSTAPYLDTYVPPEVELGRVVEAIKAIVENTNIKKPISVDTTRSIVAEAALKAGASMVNDVSGFREDPRMPVVVREYGAPVILVARVAKYNPQLKPVQQVISALRESISIAVNHGIDEDKVVVDPGIGFNRFSELPWYVWDSMVLADLEELRALGRPILVGVSRKSFIGEITGKRDPAERLYGSLAATAIAVFNGAHIVRTHDPAETVDVVKVSSFIRRTRNFKPGS